MPDVFISYASETGAQAEQVASALRAAGYNVWRDDALPLHRSFADVIEERLKAAKAVVVLWSKPAARSEWVRAEADFARTESKLVQAALHGSIPPMPFNQIQCADLSRWSGDAEDPQWRKVVASVADLVGAPGTAATRKGRSVWSRLRAARLGWLMAGAATLLAAAGGLWVLRDRLARPGPVEARVAILPFDTLSADQGVRYFSDGLVDEIRSVLSSNHVQTISRSESAALRGAGATQAVGRLAPALILDGSVEGSNDRLKVRVHLEDARNRITLWSRDFEGPASEPGSLQSEVAARSSRVVDAAVVARRGGVTDASTVTDFAMAREHLDFDWVGGLEAADSLFRRVTVRAPRFADGHAMYALNLAFMSEGGSDPDGLARRDEAAREARRALALDPRAGTAYVVLSRLAPRGNWRARESPLLKGISVDPDNGGLLLFESRFSASVGRLSTASETARRAASVFALMPGANETLGLLLVETGDEAEGRRIVEHMAKVWPRHEATLAARLWITANSGDRQAALALLADPQALPDGLNSAKRDLWRSYVSAAASGRPEERSRAAAAIGAAAMSNAFDPCQATALLAELGDVDGAFKVAEASADKCSIDNTAPPYLFISQTRSLRLDRRFMSLAAKLGLVTYWRATNNWPDFCAAPDLPYDCRAEAVRASQR
jgi:adenylate cyclase